MILLTTKILIYYLLLELFLSISNIYSLFTFYKIKYLYYILIIFMYLFVYLYNIYTKIIKIIIFLLFKKLLGYLSSVFC